MRGTGVDGEFDRRQQRFSAAAGADLARGDWAAEEWTDWLDELGRRDSAAIHHVLKDAVAPILARLRAVVAALDGMLVAKDDLNRLVVVSALAQQPLVLMGEPGTAKTALVTALAELMGVRRAERRATPAGEELVSGDLYATQLHPYIEPEEILGVLKVAALQEGRFERRFEGSITQSRLVFLDELFRGGPGMLQALLGLLNERRVYEGGLVRRARARFIFGASNSLPPRQVLEDLRALYERFPLRAESELLSWDLPGDNDPGAAPDARDLLHERGWRRELRLLRQSYDPDAVRLAPVAALNDFLAAGLWLSVDLGGEEPRGHAGMAEFERLYRRLCRGLHKRGLAKIDDRKYIRLYLVCRASDLLDRGPGHPPDARALWPLAFAWHDPDQRQDTAAAVADFIHREAGSG